MAQSISKHMVRHKDGGTVDINHLTRSKAIALMCVECLGHEVHPAECTSPMCPLYPFRKNTLLTKGKR